MPLQAEYTWKEKVDSLKLFIPIKGVPASKVDILVTASTLKVNFQPYLVDIVLKDKVSPLKHKATVVNGVLNITLFKENKYLWGTLERDTNDRTEIREASYLTQDRLEKELDEKRSDKRVEDERFALRSQMALNELERSRIDDLKIAEKTAAEAAVYATLDALKYPIQQKEQIPRLSAPSQLLREERQQEKVNGRMIDFDELIAVDDIEDSEELEEVADDHDKGDVNDAEDIEVNDREVRFLPPPRTEGISQAGADAKIGIVFTPRIFPTPMRESKAAEEEDWVSKNRKHLKNHGVLGKSLKKGASVADEDPLWLKSKGDDFFRLGDKRSALNAYSAAIEADESMISCYSNRSLCYLQLSMLPECIDDCKIGISLLERVINDEDRVSEVSAVNSLVKVLVRKGTAEGQSGEYDRALADYERALEISLKTEGHNLKIEDVRTDMDKIRKIATVDKIKREGDRAFADKKLIDAVSKYTEALSLVPFHVGCLSNRAACRIALGDIAGCIDDCSEAITLLQTDISSISTTASDLSTAAPSSINGVNILGSLLPPAGSDKRKAWVMKTVTRRGAAYAQKGELDLAIADFNIASALEPTNEALKADINKLRNLRETNKTR